MAQDDENFMKVSEQELPERRVIGVECRLDEAGGDRQASIEEGFRRVKDWLAEQGHSAEGRTLVGVPNMDGGQLRSYVCSVEAPEDVTVWPDEFATLRLDGGRYAVLRIPQDSDTIGRAVTLFYEEYMPHNDVTVDPARPIYEIYHEDVLEYCLPIKGALEIAPGPA